MSTPHTWPVSLRADASIEMLAPGDLTSDGPITWIEPQRIRLANGTLASRLVFIDADGYSNFLWPAGDDIPASPIKLGKGVRIHQTCTFRQFVFTVGEGGIVVDIDVDIPGGERLVYQVSSPTPWNGFRFAAPPGADMASPNALFVPYIFDFDFVTEPVEFTGTLGDTPLTLANMPIRRRGRRATGHKAGIGSVIVEFMPDGAAWLSSGAADTDATVDATGGLTALSVRSSNRATTVTFSPALRPLDQIVAPMTCNWELCVDGDRIAAGTHWSARIGDRVDVEIDVNAGWRGAQRPWPIWLMTRLVRFLRRWPTKYSWQGSADLHTNHQTGAWTNSR